MNARQVGEAGETHRGILKDARVIIICPYGRVDA